MRIGLTGADNFLGSYALERLKNSISVGSIDSLSVPAYDEENSDAVERFVKDKDVIVHLAAVHRADDLELMRKNLLGTLAIVNAIKGCNPSCRLIFSSSFQVYAESTADDRISEDFQIGPANTYGFCKRFEEEIILSQVNDHVIFRLSNIYGPGCKPFNNSVIATFIYLAREGKGIRITGSGDQSKDFVFVGDIVDAIEAAIDSRETGIFNICTGESISINEVVDLIRGYFPDLEVEHADGSDSGYSTKGSYEKAGSALGWKPKTPFKDGIKECV